MRYALFAGENYYPYGGWRDLVAKFETPEKAKGRRPRDVDWAHIVDLETGETVLMWEEGVRGWHHPGVMEEKRDAARAKARENRRARGISGPFMASAAGFSFVPTSASIMVPVATPAANLGL